MLMLLFSGLDAREQQSILASVGNEYDYKRVSHALRIQYPNAVSRPIYRKDYLGAGRSGQPMHQVRTKWKMQGRSKSVMAAEAEMPEYEGDDAYYEDEEEAASVATEDGYVAYSDDEALDVLLGEMTSEQLEDETVAEAFATIAQHRQGFKKKFARRPQSDGGSPNALQFKASGDISFDQKSKDQRKAAVSFIKGVTQCTACGQRGHWTGDPECPKSPKGKGHGKNSKGSPRKAGAKGQAKKSSSNYFVLHEKIESDDEVFATFAVSKNVKVSETIAVPENAQLSAYVKVPVFNDVSRNAMSLEDNAALAPNDAFVNAQDNAKGVICSDEFSEVLPAQHAHTRCFHGLSTACSL